MQEDSHNKQYFIPHALSRQVQGTRIIYITHLTNQAITDEEEQQTIAWINTHSGEKAWQDALIVFIDAHRRKPHWNRAAVLKQRSDALRQAIAIHADWDIASSIVTMIIDGHEDPLKDCQGWLERYTTSPGTYHLILAGTSEMIPHQVVPQPQRRPDKIKTVLYLFPCNPRILALFYLLSVPLSVIGLVIGGIVGYGVAIASNIVLWIVISILRILCRKQPHI